MPEKRARISITAEQRRQIAPGNQVTLYLRRKGHFTVVVDKVTRESSFTLVFEAMIESLPPTDLPNGFPGVSDFVTIELEKPDDPNNESSGHLIDRRNLDEQNL